ncbi:hypothetical protein LSAT2_007793 [Lamellibrachia satsuma]|nr:hypothetical protein LSAT2_007793 [Lamellibrachia satsuma]
MLGYTALQEAIVVDDASTLTSAEKPERASTQKQPPADKAGAPCCGDRADTSDTYPGLDTCSARSLPGYHAEGLLQSFSSLELGVELAEGGVCNFPTNYQGSNWLTFYLATNNAYVNQYTSTGYKEGLNVLMFDANCRDLYEVDGDVYYTSKLLKSCFRAQMMRNGRKHFGAKKLNNRW